MKIKPYTAFPPAEIAEMRAEAAPYDASETLDVSAGCFRRLLDAAEHRAELLEELKKIATRFHENGDAIALNFSAGTVRDIRAAIAKAGAS